MKQLAVVKATLLVAGLVLYLGNQVHAQAPISTNKVTLLSPLNGSTGEYMQNLKQTSANPFGLSLSTNNLPRIVILQNGNVGIGNVNPQGVLDVTGATLFDSITGKANFLPFRLKAGAGMAFSINNFGVGAGFIWNEAGAQPGTLMTLNGNASPSGLPSIGKPRLDVNGVVNATGFTVAGKALTSSQWTTTGNNISYTIGNIGIGATSPGFPLNFSTAVGDKVSFWGNTGNHYGIGVQNHLLQLHVDAASSDMAFGYGTSAAFTELMRIKGNGNVGIGTNAPGAKLHVKGKIIADSVDASVLLVNGVDISGGISPRSTPNETTYYGYGDRDLSIDALSWGMKFSINDGVRTTPGYQDAVPNIGSYTWYTKKDVVGMTLDKSNRLTIAPYSNGPKISVFKNAADANLFYGIDMAANLMQIHTDVKESDIAFGYGTDGVAPKFKEIMRIKGTGKVMIWGDSPLTIKSTLLDKYSLFVAKGVLSGDYAIAPVTSWADYVFNESYKLKSLKETEQYISTNHHLPDVPSEDEVRENGYSVHDINVKLLQKIEELTLHAIEQQKEIDLLKQQMKENLSMRKNSKKNK